MQWVQRTFVGDGSLFMRSSLSPSALYGQCSETNFVKHGVLLLQLLARVSLLLLLQLLARVSLLLLQLLARVSLLLLLQLLARGVAAAATVGWWRGTALLLLLLLLTVHTGCNCYYSAREYLD